MARQRLTQKEIKQPDRFISNAVLALEWAKAHAMHLLCGALGVVAVVAIVVAWSSWQASRHRSADVLLYEAIKLLEADAGEQAKPEDVATAIRKLKRVVSDYSGTPAAPLAHWHLGHHFYGQADFGMALSSYQQAQALLRRDEQRLLPALVTLNIAYAQEANSACDQAIASFEEVLRSSMVWLHGEAFLGVGRCHEVMGATDRARDVYAQALSGEAVQGAMRQRLEERQSALQMTLNASEATSGKDETKQDDLKAPAKADSQ